ncbi:MAG: hypothetical protein MRY63_02240 [Neomegalonema sp.]|nr:hypothetical protein [Neomegalonema sp.]
MWAYEAGNYGGSSSTTDRMYGEDGNDFMGGHAGADIMYGGDGNDTQYGAAGNDSLYGDAGNDVINGGSGNDYLNGGSGNDSLEGGAGNDYIYAGTGSELVSGGSGNDTMNISDGRAIEQDTVDFNRGNDHDTVYGFQAGEDKLDLRSFNYSRFNDFVNSATITSDSAGTTIDFGQGDILELAGVNSLVGVDIEI